MVSSLKMDHWVEWLAVMPVIKLLSLACMFVVVVVLVVVVVDLGVETGLMVTDSTISKHPQ